MQGTRSRTSSLAPVINMEVAKTDTSWMTLVSSFEAIGWQNGSSSYSGSTQLGRGLPLSSGWRRRPSQVSLGFIPFHAEGLRGGPSSGGRRRLAEWKISVSVMSWSRDLPIT